MLGAIIGDIIGSHFEWNNYLKKDFEFFHPDCHYTDDTVMTCAVAQSLITDNNFIKQMQYLGHKYAIEEYGANFSDWLQEDNPQPYNSCGNGAAMRISPIGFYANTIDEVKNLTKKATEISHNHKEGLRGAEAIAVAIFMANQGKSKQEIYHYMKLYYKFNKRLDDYRKLSNGHGKEICQVTVPQALMCFFEGNNYEDVIRNCISIGGDSDTLAAIAGGIAEAYYGIPQRFIYKAFDYLPYELHKIILDFYKVLRNKKLYNEDIIDK